MFFGFKGSIDLGSALLLGERIPSFDENSGEMMMTLLRIQNPFKGSVIPCQNDTIL